ncbi:sugar ABC transporter permease [Clostridium sp. YIM B02505]|uniref:Sugar ABC transporter permease n=1 Tax=Clostridium yunnanense TaxID=2800325 RepID=A0ABS1EQR8_9CLOT|nr:sugar ABC transporter permease [Clostridium yunnanense]MBK1811746.1 sugar ABC transporter permease [Clostridium yunnanense]
MKGNVVTTSETKVQDKVYTKISMWKKMKKNKTAYYFILPSMLIILLLSLGPIIYGIGLSFTNYNIYTEGEMSKQASFKKDVEKKENEIKNEADATKKVKLEQKLKSFEDSQIKMLNNEKLDQLKKYYNNYKDENNIEAMKKVQKDIDSVDKNIKAGTLYEPLQFVGVSNYIKAIKADSEFMTVLLRTVVWTVINLALQVFTGVFVAILIHRKSIKLKKVMRGILILPWIMPQLISCLVWKAMFNTEFGFINFMATKIVDIFKPGATVGITWLQTPTLAFIAVIIVNVWIGIPFITMSATSALQSIPEELYEAGTMDGCNAFNSLRYITIPLLKTALVPAILMGTIWTFNCFNVPYLITEQGSNTPVFLVSNYMFKSMRTGSYNIASAYSVIVFLILLVVTIINIRTSKTLEEV